MPFQPGNQAARGGNNHKRRIIIQQQLIAVLNEVDGSNITKLRRVVDALVAKAQEGDVSAIKEIAERVDGKVPQAIHGDPDNPLVIERVIHEIVRADPNQRINPPDAGYSKAS